MEYLREATIYDLNILFKWANDEDVRKNSFSVHPITYEEHKKWFENLLNRKDARQYIFVCGDEPAGQVRITVCGEVAKIGYSICPEKRCMGYGKEMIGLLKMRMEQDFPQVKKLLAEVKPDNAASRKVFLDLGFEEKYVCYEIDMGYN